ncbi:hypothetical protein [Vulcaniibacterium tengchongense]|uniref:Uncharacterized protein n=1 Tax=Vulcaniibacterium tengchongense TaxID=1273429 RepID=A0A3N4VK79_9GAMM|nr:hypothetical protein [Vulcaniibacterium tengchongense]RPE81845.1 hypothetical protein EDC50_1047 [Vulcaniibacterium tengchongense]
MSIKPTPTRHGAWRVIDGQLVDESQALQTTIDDPAPPSQDRRAATEPSLGNQAGPAESPSPRRKARFKAD